MIVVTGGAGFIGSNLVAGLNELGYQHILVVDDLSDGSKFANLVDCEFTDYMDKDEFINIVGTNRLSISTVFHLGACSDTTEWDGRWMMRNNFSYSKDLFQYCQHYQIPFIYASSAAVYGANNSFKETRDNERPLNVYGFSKYQFDRYVRQHWYSLRSPVVGLRYFNVYGPGEWHKGKMASVAYHMNQQLQKGDTVKLFEGCHGYGDGEQRRDFVYVKDAVDVNLWCWQNRKTGIFNVGTGSSQTFNELANAVINWYGRGRIEYIPFPQHLENYYQSFTEADLTNLRQAGYNRNFRPVEQGVQEYLDRINSSNSV